MGEGRVLGVDACKAGWVGIALGDGMPVPHFAAGIGELVEMAGADGWVEVVAVDMPIGLPDSGRRQADLLARGEAGARGSSVFVTPVREALLAQTHAAAVEVNRDRAGMGISIQAFSLRTKILEVDQWIRQAPCRVIEVHPEVCFAHLADKRPLCPKSTWAGVEERRALLAEAGIVLAADLGTAGRTARVDDVLDAAAAAWTARRFASKTAESFPAEPQIFSDGLPSAIWA